MLGLLVGSLIVFQARREGLAGLLAGLALVSRPTALIPLIALGVLLLAGGEGRGLLKLAGAGALVAGVIMAPVFLFDRPDTTDPFLSWHGLAPIGGDSLWGILAHGAPGGIRSALDAL